MLKNRKKLFLLALPLLLSVTVFITAFTEDLFEISKNLDVFSSMYRELNLYYVDETKPGQLIKTASDAMLQSLDPYTEYYTESEIEDYKIITTGQYGGIGASVREIADKVLISEVYEASPAAKAGIKTGDMITEINGTAVKGKSPDDISRLMKGQAGTPIKLKIERLGETKLLDFNIVREEIRVKDVPYYGMLNKETGYIKLTGFTQDAAKEVREAYMKLKNENSCKSLVLDLRENPGGLLYQAVDIVNFFVEKGIDICVTKGRVKDWEQTYKAVNPPLDLTMPLIVLVDRNSASAAEVVSGSLQDLDRAVVIGQRTYGKGLVQQTKPLTYNAQLKLTVAKYYIPSGRCIQALDYSHRNEDGSVDHVSDSLITAFKTRNGRIVYDGAGILPDVQTEPQNMSDITYALAGKNFIFDFATLYVIKHPALNVQPKDFILTDKEYEEFVSHLAGKDYTYKTNSEEALVVLKKTAEEDKYFADIENEFKLLEKKLLDRKKDDLQKFKAEVKHMIEDEILSRYFYLKGRIESSLRYDNDVIEAIALLNKADKMKAMLTTIEKPKKPFNANKKF
ncbi:MAG TPA: S41 family peptidase [Bacteroidia bacterium]|jgi:carboxyl-terminal processing protease|nr:S41 family peptidase [Bacteroidia bacterium]